MKKFVSTLLLSTALLSVSVFAGDNPIMNIDGDTCPHGESYIEQICCYVFGD